jgi:hypothetical protein
MLDIHALRQLCEAATTIWLDPCDGTYEDFPVKGGGEYVALPAAARTAIHAALAEIESLRAEVAAARAAQPVAWGVEKNGEVTGAFLFQTDAVASVFALADANFVGYRVVPLIIQPGAGG